MPARPFVDRGGAQRAVALAVLLLSSLRAAAMLRRFRAALVFATGGYVCAPAALASRLHGCGLYLLEPNAESGAANRTLSRFATEAGVAFESAAGDLAMLSVPKFPIATSPVELTGPVRPGEYLGVTGPRAAWLGVETGEAELWVHPLKVGRGFRLFFQAPGDGAPIPGELVARTVQVRPELTTINYSHAAFQVRQHILAPRGARMCWRTWKAAWL